MKDHSFSFFSLGGIGEIGLNCYVLTISNESFIVDMGVDFPDNNYSSIGVILPDISVLKNHHFPIKGIIFTHGHDDHIGAFPHYAEQFNVPVFASPFAAELIRHKLKDMQKRSLKNITLITENNKKIKIGSLLFNFFQTSHSIPQSYGFFVDTPLGNIVFTSDFKDIPDMGTIPRKPFILFSDSTNAETESDIDENAVRDNISQIFCKATGAIIATTFSSHIERISMLVDFAGKFGKELFIVGKNIENTVAIAKKLGIIKPLKINSWDKINSVPRDRVVVISTGSQGERFSSLSLISKGSYRGFEIRKGDTIIVSSSIIPGNEINIYNMINRFAEKEVIVYYANTSLVHSSGHGSRKVLKRVIRSLKPEYIVPIHGEARHLFSLKNLVLQMGYDENRVILLKNGDVINATDKGLNITRHFDADRVFMDDEGGYKIDRKVIKERRKLSENGVVFIVIIINDGLEIRVESMGLVTEDERCAFDKDIKDEIKAKVMFNYYVAEADYSALKEAVTMNVKMFVKRKIGKKPVVKIEIVEG